MLPSRHLVRSVVLATAIIMALVACTASGSASGAVTVNSASSSLGTILTGPNGKTLYIHAGDSVNTSTCTGACISSWPALTVGSGQQPTAGSGVTGHLGTFSRADGSLQVTYDGLPLYQWQGDTKAGDVTGQGISGFTVALVSGSSNASRTPAASASSGSRGY